MIGIFDSGLGGLTALKEIKKLTGEGIIYFGDTGRVPYGGRSSATITKYAEQDAAFLMSKSVDAIVVACGTVSTTALDHLKDITPVPVIGVVEPSAEAAVNATKNGKIIAIILANIPIHNPLIKYNKQISRTTSIMFTNL